MNVRRINCFWFFSCMQFDLVWFVRSSSNRMSIFSQGMHYSVKHTRKSMFKQHYHKPRFLQSVKKGFMEQMEKRLIHSEKNWNDVCIKNKVFISCNHWFWIHRHHLFSSAGCTASTAYYLVIVTRGVFLITVDSQAKCDKSLHKHKNYQQMIPIQFNSTKSLATANSGREMSWQLTNESTTIAVIKSQL